MIFNYLYNMLYQVFILIIPLVTIPYISRVIGPTGIGINTYTYAITQYFILLATLGVNLYGGREIAYRRDNKKKLSKTFWEIESLLIMTVIMSTVLFLIFININREYHSYYLAQGISIVAVAFDISWFFMGLENFKVTVTRNILVKAISLACIFIFVKSKNDLFIYILITSLSVLFGNITLWPYLKGKVDMIQIKELHPTRHLLPAIALFIPQIAINIYSVLNKPMLKIFSSVESAGFFDSSDKIIKLLVALLTSLATVVMPRVASNFMNGNHQQVKKLLTKSFDYISFVSIPLMFGIAGVSQEFSILFFGPKFSSVGNILLVESLVIPLIAWASITGNQYLLPTNHNKEYTSSVIIGAIFNLILNIPLIVYLGAIGAALSTILSEFIVTAIQLYYVNKDFSVFQLFKGCYRYVISGLIMFILLFIMNHILSISIVHLIIEVLVGAVIYFTVLIIFKTPILYEIINRGKNFLKR
ncbi:flippase [Companilactobacillus sp. DQM5]|uniref:flippase n=1 Tax=Companilactobacillus sp. DQM5 TaxID=3463359 RepID=UPI004058D09A